MEQKFFFFDIDNTLAVWPEGKIPDSAQYSLDELKRRGHRVALATGRIQVDAKRFAEQGLQILWQTADIVLLLIMN